MDSLLHDIRTALRSLRAEPVLTGLTVAAIGLGLGVASALFGIVEAVVLDPLPYRDPSGLVVVAETHPERGWDWYPVAPAKLRDWRERTRSMAALVPFASSTLNVTGTELPERVVVSRIGHDLFELLGARPALGRPFGPEDEIPGNDRAVILGHALWRQRFGADPGALGRTLGLEGQDFRIVGVMPEGFDFPDGAQLWVPLAIANWPSRAAHGFWVLGRLEPGVGVRDARADLASVAADLEADYPDTDAGWEVGVRSLHEYTVGDVDLPLFALLGGAALVILIGCANLANVQLARATRRQTELAVRSALGASGLRLARQQLFESLTLSMAGGVLALLLAGWAIEALVWLAPRDLPRIDGVGLDAGVLAFGFGVSLFTGAVFGMVPAAQVRKVGLQPGLRAGSRASSGGPRSLLVVTEVAVALTLVSAAGLLIKSLASLEEVDPGVNVRSVVTAAIRPPAFRYRSAAARAQLYRQVVDGAAALPGVSTAGMSSHLPFTGASETFRFRVEGEPERAFADIRTAEIRSVSPRYFATMGIAVRAGRGFGPPATSGASPEVLINETMARRYWPGEEAVGKRISIDGAQGPWRTIVGVVGDVRHFGLGRPAVPELYLPFSDPPWPATTLVVRTSREAEALATPLREMVRRLDPDLPLADVRALEEIFAASMARPRFNARLGGIFAAAALALALTGVYAVASYTAARRRREMGIRLALGARPADIRRLLVGQGLLLGCAGVAMGLIGGLAVSRAIASLLHGIDSADPATFAVSAVVMVGCAVAATWVPARRVMGTDPAEVLRAD